MTGLAGQTLGQVRQVTENPPGGKPVSLTTNESGRTVQRAVGTSGDIIEIILDENVDLVDETLLGSLADLPIEEEYRNEQGRTIRTVKEESGPLSRPGVLAPPPAVRRGLEDGPGTPIRGV